MALPRGDIQTQYPVQFVCPSVHSPTLVSTVKMTEYIIISEI